MHAALRSWQWSSMIDLHPPPLSEKSAQQRFNNNNNTTTYKHRNMSIKSLQGHQFVWVGAPMATATSQLSFFVQYQLQGRKGKAMRYSHFNDIIYLFV